MKVQLNHANAKVPNRANPNDAGADLFSPIYEKIPMGESRFIDFGVAIELPENSVGLLFPRSSLGGKGIRLRNAVGVIDEKYRGNIGMMVENVTGEDYEIRIGDRIAQLVIVPILTPTFEIADELCMEDDRQGGFGSSGR